MQWKLQDGHSIMLRMIAAEVSEYTTKAGGSAANTVKGLASGFGVRCQLVRPMLHGGVSNGPPSASHQHIWACITTLTASLGCHSAPPMCLNLVACLVGGRLVY